VTVRRLPVSDALTLAWAMTGTTSNAQQWRRQGEAHLSAMGVRIEDV
jgi:hypothetical protein